MKERPIGFTTELIPKILDGTKTQTRRVITPTNSDVGEGKVDWGKFDFTASTFANAVQRDLMRNGVPDSIADVSLRDNGRAPLPWVDNSVSPKYGVDYTWQYLHVPYDWAENGTIYRIYTKWQVGDRLWVRETWRTESVYDNTPPCDIDSDALIEYKATPDAVLQVIMGKTRSPLHLPRWASRITLQITNLRVERLQEITEEDSEAEGESWMGAGDGENYDVYSARECFANLWDSLNAKRGHSWESNPWVWVIEFKKLRSYNDSAFYRREDNRGHRKLRLHQKSAWFRSHAPETTGMGNRR